MLNRRYLLAAAPTVLAGLSAAAPALAQAPQKPSRATTPEEAESFARYIAGVKDEARRKGISAAVLDRAFAGVHINWRVIELDRNQPEVQFHLGAVPHPHRQRHPRPARPRAIGQAPRPAAPRAGPLRRAAGDHRRAVGPGIRLRPPDGRLQRHRGGGDAGLGRPSRRLFPRRVDGLPENPPGRRHRRRRRWSEAGPARWARPSSCRTASCTTRSISTATAGATCGTASRDVFASTANNLAVEGWKARAALGLQVRLPAAFDPALAGRDKRQPAADWARWASRRWTAGRWRPATAWPRSCCPAARRATRSWSIPAISGRCAPTTRPTITPCRIGLLADRIAD